jgi:hypothetical protein
LFSVVRAASIPLSLEESQKQIQVRAIEGNFFFFYAILSDLLNLFQRTMAHPIATFIAKYHNVETQRYYIVVNENKHRCHLGRLDFPPIDLSLIL